MTSLRGEERTEFPAKVRKAAFIRCCQEGTKPGIPQCETCGAELKAGNIRYEHVQADGLGGEPTLENCKVHCRNCASDKDKIDNAIMAKADAQLKRAFGLRPIAKRKLRSKGFAKAPPQRTATRPVERRT